VTFPTLEQLGCTPGPWWAEDGPVALSAHYPHNSKPGGTIWAKGHPVGSWTYNAPNARLQAASPEMYDALVELIDVTLECEGCDKAADDRLMDARIKARVALTKAIEGSANT